MDDRIIVRTVVNISYVGNICKCNFFDDEGIVLKPNPKCKMMIYIPKNEIKEMIYKGERVDCSILECLT